jgi:imidazolonepropionase-like amidohydrolase
MKTILTGATVIDGSGGPARRDAAVVIDGDRVAEIRAAGDPAPADSRAADSEAADGGHTVYRLDAGYTIIPGLVDCHDHIGHPGLDPAANRVQAVPHAVAIVARALRDTVEAGVTTVRDAGGLGYGFKVAVDEGLFTGPRLVLSLAIMSRTGGLGDSRGVFGYGSEQWIIPGVPDGVCDGPEAGRTKVRELQAAGAGAIKVAMTGGVRSGALQPGFSAAEVEAIVAEAHILGLRVLCHCHGGPGLSYALAAGVDSIDHGVYLADDEKSLARMAADGTFFVPTMLALRYHEQLAAGQARQAISQLREQHRRGLARAAELGIRIAMGTDAGAFGHSHQAAELELLVEAGFSPMQALVTATSSSAACIGMGGEVGTLAPGYFADLVVVQGDPLADIRILQDPDRIKMVMKSGTPIRNHLPAAPVRPQ